MTTIPTKGLRLQAKDEEDFRVIAACLQDSVLRLGEMQYLRSDRRFVAVLDRFVWERSTKINKNSSMLYQVQSGLCFDGIASVYVQGINQECKEVILELLTIVFDLNTVTLVFSGSAAIRLEGEDIVCFLEDVGDPRPCDLSPRHPVRPVQ
ncbi:uncharacterized protein METZ01_LOCUS413959 [marine metagenome]|uniref:DUF2948 domain-containing protein n=1 Tax=marine metagenome TaxID=408172 RepID=A0A382WRS7_9ZZZZ